MITDVTMPPRRVPRVGVVLDLAKRDLPWHYGPMRLRVARIREDISRWYGGELIWLEGIEVPNGKAAGPARLRQVLVRCDAIPEPPA